MKTMHMMNNIAIGKPNLMTTTIKFKMVDFVPWEGCEIFASIGFFSAFIFCAANDHNQVAILQKYKYVDDY